MAGLARIELLEVEEKRGEERRGGEERRREKEEKKKEEKEKTERTDDDIIKLTILSMQITPNFKAATTTARADLVLPPPKYRDEISQTDLTTQPTTRTQRTQHHSSIIPIHRGPRWGKDPWRQAHRRVGELESWRS